MGGFCWWWYSNNSTAITFDLLTIGDVQFAMGGYLNDPQTMKIWLWGAEMRCENSDARNLRCWKLGVYVYLCGWSNSRGKTSLELLNTHKQKHKQTISSVRSFKSRSYCSEVKNKVCCTITPLLYHDCIFRLVVSSRVESSRVVCVLRPSPSFWQWTIHPINGTSHLKNDARTGMNLSLNNPRDYAGR